MYPLLQLDFVHATFPSPPQFPQFELDDAQPSPLHVPQLELESILTSPPQLPQLYDDEPLPLQDEHEHECPENAASGG